MRVLVFLGLLLLSACGSSSDGVPIGAGGDMDELRKSPCACGPEIPARSQWVG